MSESSDGECSSRDRERALGPVLVGDAFRFSRAPENPGDGAGKACVRTTGMTGSGQRSPVFVQFSERPAASRA